MAVGMPQLLPPYERLRRTGTVGEGHCKARTSHLYKGSVSVMGQGSYRVEGSDRRTWERWITGLTSLLESGGDVGQYRELRCYTDPKATPRY